MYDQIFAILGLIGFGSILKSAFDFFIANKKLKEDSKNNLKETRYKAIIILCHSLVFYEENKSTLTNHRPELNSIENLKNEIYTEFINMSLFASDNVLIEMKKFIQLPNIKNLNNLLIVIRKDLYGIKTKISDNFFELS
ncbi:hypothetical protein [Chryseobacterium oryctis]|uniref:Uncharacterized protein n=1 Tax=Chryseobacterium oryctis TaxID=2952618 RepID=A0ABT3HJV1_9FLAO|nr:hypothetical protein [Chryseobacterium oryctis]MCW3160049.1 hypothetical protein [Chryseobacterium oryctis]